MRHLFINLVGHSASGKSTLAQKLADDLSLNVIDADPLRQFISTHVRYFNNLNISYPNERYAKLHSLIAMYRLEMSHVLLAAGESVIYDGSGAKREFRQKYLDPIKQEFPDVMRVIVYVTLPEAELLQRLKDRGDSWTKLYTDIKRDSFEPPTADEAEVLLEYNQHNYDKIKEEIEQLIG